MTRPTGSCRRWKATPRSPVGNRAAIGTTKSRAAIGIVARTTRSTDSVQRSLRSRFQREERPRSHGDRSKNDSHQERSLAENGSARRRHRGAIGKDNERSLCENQESTVRENEGRTRYRTPRKRERLSRHAARQAHTHMIITFTSNCML